ncbi:MAG TPA: flagellar hook capping FlgD N-terminal domain-containing protein [Planctomycetota bacterium]
MLNAVTFAGPGTASAPRASATETRDQFIRLLVAELTSQDPLDPVENGDFMQQIVAMQNLEQTSALTDGLRAFERFQQMASGSAMIGRQISGLTADGQSVSGTVASVTLQNGDVLATLADGTRVPLGSVTEIR